MACRELPPPQRRWGLVIGAGVAVVLRIVLVGVLTWLMLLPYLKLVGGVALMFIAAKLLVPEDPDRDEIRAVAHLWRAVMIIAIADIVMSIDNMVAIAAIAQGNLLLLAIGLAVSIPLIVAGAALVLALLNRFPILIWAGTALLGWIAGEPHCRRCGAVATFGRELRRTTRAANRIRRARHGCRARNCRGRAVAVLARQQGWRGAAGKQAAPKLRNSVAAAEIYAKCGAFSLLASMSSLRYSQCQHLSVVVRICAAMVAPYF